ncbi:MAG: HD domain-containing protein [Treponemataceae bacterium]|nr:HD domain-containing protein [Treponemataceae bacterium]
MDISSVSDQKLRSIIESEKILNEIQDVDVMLERALYESCRIVNADAGSIYIIEGDRLFIKYAINETERKKLAPGQKLPYQNFSFPINEKSVNGFCAITKQVINLEDAYDISSDAPYIFNKTSDNLTGYRTRSMVSLPLVNQDGVALGVLQIINAQNDDGEIVSFSEEAIFYLQRFAATVTQALERANLTREMVYRMIHMVSFRDPKETGAHVNRVSSYAVEIYDRYAFNHGISDLEANHYRDSLKIAAMLHDVGKIGISDIILKKPGRFTPEEFNIVKAHTIIGALLFKSKHSPIDIMANDVAFRHHERWDGTGYPGKIDLSVVDETCPVAVPCEGLKGTEIPLAARIVAVADVYDALSSERVYKEAWNEEAVLQEIRNQSGKQFDPELIDIFFSVLPRIKQIQSAFIS